MAGGGGVGGGRLGVSARRSRGFLKGSERPEAGCLSKFWEARKPCEPTT